MAAVLNRLMQARAIQPVVLGYSMGGRLALEWATTHSDHQLKKLVLVSATAGIENDREREARRSADLELAKHIRVVGPVQFAEEWERHPIIRSQMNIPEADRHLMQARRRNQKAEGLALSLEEAGTGAMGSRWDLLKKIHCPTLLVSGQNDPKFSEIGAKLAARIQGAQTVNLNGVGHCAHLENQNDFIVTFLRFGFAKSRGRT